MSSRRLQSDAVMLSAFALLSVNSAKHPCMDDVQRISAGIPPFGRNDKVLLQEVYYIFFRHASFGFAQNRFREFNTNGNYSALARISL
jgi:hypothetical protein